MLELLDGLRARLFAAGATALIAWPADDPARIDPPPAFAPRVPSFNGPTPSDRPLTDRSVERAAVVTLPPLPGDVSPPSALPKTTRSDPGGSPGTAAPAVAAPAAAAQAPAAAPMPPSAVQPAAPAASAIVGDPAVDAKVARADAEARLAVLPTPPTPPPAGAPAPATPAAKVVITPQQKALRETLLDRISWLDALDRAAHELDAAVHPQPDPDKEAADRKADLERAKAVIEAAAGDPRGLLPERFRAGSTPTGDAALAELSEAIETARAELKERSDEVEKLRGKPGRPASAGIAALRSERDKAAQRVASLPARRTEREKALAEATNTDARDLARDRLIAFAWEARAEERRLEAIEARIKLEQKRTDVAGITLQARELQARVAKLTLEQLQTRYRSVSDSRESNLQRAAAHEADRAHRSEDALERFKAGQQARILELEAELTGDERSLAANPKISLLEQTQLADRAAAELADLQALLEDDKVSSLDALQLNNDFRRVLRERSLIQRRELADAAAILAHYENELTELELELLSDARDDRFELENLLTLLPEERHDDARKLVDRLDHDHRTLLVKRRVVLDKLVGRAKATHTQVLRRIQILDDQYAIVRTTLFWIRDAEPLGPGTLSQAKRELRQVGPAAVRLVAEPFDRRLWSEPSVEFGLASLGVVTLPWVILSIRKALRGLV
ncbi:MAG: hypothetical protein SFX72_12500 [Isosphaeraceae bacterium]|nr:hypothetical protein [Isosphaeraceae bacterium]